MIEMSTCIKWCSANRLTSQAVYNSRHYKSRLLYTGYTTTQGPNQLDSPCTDGVTPRGMYGTGAEGKATVVRKYLNILIAVNTSN